MRPPLFCYAAAIASIFFSQFVKGQGCSDAGFCTIGNLAAAKSADTSVSKQSLTLSIPVGVGDEGVLVVTPAIEYSRVLSERFSIQSRLTANFASGNLGTALGAGDFFISGTYNIYSRSKWKPSFTLGAKLPLSNANLKHNELPLPMQYQSSLGTIDIIAGFSVSSDDWQFAAGYQQPVSGTNGNNFLPAYWDDMNAHKFPPTNDFNRKADLLLRIAYKLRSRGNWQITTGLLGIYHVGDDTYIDGNISSDPIPIQGSQGLTLNATMALSYKLNNKWSIGLNAGVPVVVRDVRPDGLTRAFVFSPEIRFNF